MTNLERLNSTGGTNGTAEHVAVGMLIACIANRYRIDMDESVMENFGGTYYAMKHWLESEVKE